MEDLQLDTLNPYAFGTILVFEDGDVSMEPPLVKYPSRKRDRLFTTVQGNNLSQIAQEAYNSSKAWWLLYLSNDVEFPFDLEDLEGTVLRVPDMDLFKMINV